MRHHFMGMGIVFGGFVLGSVYGCTTQVSMESQVQEPLELPDQTVIGGDEALLQERSGEGLETWQFGALAYTGVAFVARDYFSKRAEAKIADMRQRQGIPRRQ